MDTQMAKIKSKLADDTRKDRIADLEHGAKLNEMEMHLNNQSKKLSKDIADENERVAAEKMQKDLEARAEKKAIEKENTRLKR
jgi:hypothetical protein